MKPAEAYTNGYTSSKAPKASPAALDSFAVPPYLYPLAHKVSVYEHILGAAACVTLLCIVLGCMGVTTVQHSSAERTAGTESAAMQQQGGRQLSP